MNKTPLVSILVPIYRAEAFIERCARSIFEQTYHNLEIVFVDDCSPDQSIKIIESVLADYPHRVKQVKIVRHNCNRGVSAARNTSIDSSTGKFISFVDSDDYIERDAVEHLVEEQIRGDYDIVTGRVYDHWKDHVEEYMDGGWQTNKENALIGFLNGDLSYSLWRRLIRRSLFIDNSIKCKEGTNMYEDLLLEVSLFYYAQSVSGLNTFIYHYMRENDSSYVANYHINYDLQDQALSSFKDVMSFFEGKNRDLYVLTQKRLTNKTRYIMQWSGRNHDKKRFDSISHSLLSQKDCWPFIGWDNSLVRRVESNYYIYRFAACIKNALNLFFKSHNH